MYYLSKIQIPIEAEKCCYLDHSFFFHAIHCLQFVLPTHKGHRLITA